MEPCTGSRDADSYEEFLSVYARDRDRLFAYIYSLVPRRDDAEDIFQKCSLVLWRKFASFDRSRSFLAWACGVAAHEVRQHLRTMKSGRLCFNSELMSELAERRASHLEAEPLRAAALRQCLQRMTSRDRDLLQMAYSAGSTLKQFAEASGQALQTVYNRLARLRKALAECVERRISSDSEPVQNAQFL
jgi:RNA polymerase sigma-70 factor (ECF subfamily)